MGYRTKVFGLTYPFLRKRVVKVADLRDAIQKLESLVGGGEPFLKIRGVSHGVANRPGTDDHTLGNPKTYKMKLQNQRWRKLLENNAIEEIGGDDEVGAVVKGGSVTKEHQRPRKAHHQSAKMRFLDGRREVDPKLRVVELVEGFFATQRSNCSYASNRFDCHLKSHGMRFLPLNIKQLTLEEPSKDFLVCETSPTIFCS